jgi:hypothetical protein
MGNHLECPACDVARRHVGTLPCPPYTHIEDGQSPAVRALCRAFPVRDASRPVVGATRRTPTCRWTPPPYAIGSPRTRTSPSTLAHTVTLQGLDARKPASPTRQAIKTRPPFPLAHRSWATAELPPRRWSRTASSTLRPLAPPTRVAPACPRIPSSSPFRLLLRPSHQLAGAELSAPAAAGLRHTRLPVASLPWVSTQVGSPQLLDPPQPLPWPRPSARSSESGRPRRPLAPGLHCLLWLLSKGVIMNQGHNCEHSKLSKGLFAKWISPFCVF